MQTQRFIERIIFKVDKDCALRLCHRENESSVLSLTGIELVRINSGFMFLDCLWEILAF